MTTFNLTMARPDAEELVDSIRRSTEAKVVIADVAEEPDFKFGFTEAAATVTIILGAIKTVESLLVIAKTLISISQQRNDPVRALLRGKRDETVFDVTPSTDAAKLARELEEVVEHE